MNIHKSKHLQSGQSLVEVVVATIVISLILVALVSAITFSLSNVQYSRNKAMATKYAQQGVEWLRNYRDISWYSFNGRAADAGSTYCMNSLTFSAGSCAINTYINDDYDIFTRETILTGNAADDRVMVQVTVRWKQGVRDERVIVNTYLTKWL